MTDRMALAKADLRAVTVLADLTFAAERCRGSRISSSDIQALQASSLGPLMRACMEWGRSAASDGLEPPDLTILAALRTDIDPSLERAPDHVVEALKREARDRAFRQELAEATLKAERERWLHAARLAEKGDLRALIRLARRTENPVPIQGSAALPVTNEGAGSC